MSNIEQDLTGASPPDPGVSRINLEVAGLFEVHLPVSDKAASIIFYRDVVGLVPAHVSDKRDYAFFWIGEPGSQMLGLWGPHCSNPPVSKGVSHFAMRTSTSDIVQALSALQEAGLTPLNLDGEPTDEPVVIGWMPAIAVYFKDPDGHSLEFISMLDEEPRADLGVVKLSEWEKKR